MSDILYKKMENQILFNDETQKFLMKPFKIECDKTKPNRFIYVL